MSRYADLDDHVDSDESVAILDNIGRRMLKRQVDALKSLPTFPESIMRINSVLLEDNSHRSMEQIARAIEVDPVVTARILRLVNSAFYGVSGAVASVYDALVMLGLDVVRGIVLSSAAMDIASRRRSVHGLWEHSFGAAVAASALARTLGMPGVEEASAAALMHDIGKLVLASQLGRDYDAVIAHAVRNRVPVRDAELKLLGVSHDVIGQWLVKRWRLPDSLAQPIASHHTPGEAESYRDLTAVVHVADQMIRGYGFGFPGDNSMPALSEKAWKRLSLNDRKLRRAVIKMHTDLQEAIVHANLYVAQ
ncbi:MAG: HDOD domain-containing protein [Bradymonadia bacterium]